MNELQRAGHGGIECGDRLRIRIVTRKGPPLRAAPVRFSGFHTSEVRPPCKIVTHPNLLADRLGRSVSTSNRRRLPIGITPAMPKRGRASPHPYGCNAQKNHPPQRASRRHRSRGWFPQIEHPDSSLLGVVRQAESTLGPRGTARSAARPPRDSPGTHSARRPATHIVLHSAASLPVPCQREGSARSPFRRSGSGPGP